MQEIVLVFGGVLIFCGFVLLGLVIAGQGTGVWFKGVAIGLFIGAGLLAWSRLA